MEKPILVYRGKYVESAHNIHIAIVDSTGKLIYYYGDYNQLTFARSAMKPFQAVPFLATGAKSAFHFDHETIAIACASHSGEQEQVKLVEQMLKTMDIEETMLQCGIHRPWNTESYTKLVKEQIPITSLYHNCSGKHAAMLATAIYMNEDRLTYQEITHAVQQRISKAISTICEVQQDNMYISEDGCGVPTFALLLKNIALGYAKLAKANFELGEIRDAMLNHPYLVAGTKRFDTDLMNTCRGKVISKAGAEGVQCLSLVEEGLGICIKVEDGAIRAANATAMEVLKQIGFLNQSILLELKKYVCAPILNPKKETISYIQPNFQLRQA